MEHQIELLQPDFVPLRNEITTDYDAGAVRHVVLHDGSCIRLRKVADDYDPTDRDLAYAHVRERQAAGEVPTGLFYISPVSQDMIEQCELVPEPLYNLPFENLCPGSAELEKLQLRFR